MKRYWKWLLIVLMLHALLVPLPTYSGIRMEIKGPVGQWWYHLKKTWSSWLISVETKTVCIPIKTYNNPHKALSRFPSGIDYVLERIIPYFDIAETVQFTFEPEHTQYLCETTPIHYEFRIGILPIRDMRWRVPRDLCIPNFLEPDPGPAYGEHVMCLPNPFLEVKKYYNGEIFIGVVSRPFKSWGIWFNMLCDVKCSDYRISECYYETDCNEDWGY